MKNIVFLFDGQGAFKPGIGKELCNRYRKAKEVVNECSEILGYDLTEFLWGQKANETANRTSIAQLAISATSIAYAEVLRDLGLSGEISLGHSLGEVTAIVYCGVVSFEDGMTIIKKRGEVMERAGKEGTMMAVLNIELSALEKICEKVSKAISKPVVVANINAPNQIVISGSKDGVQRVAQVVAENRGRGIPLSIGGAWHSPYLKDAAEEFAQFLANVEFTKPSSKFYSVVEQKMLNDGAVIKDSLKRQMLSQVNWVNAINNLENSGHETYLEIGPSKILKDLVVKIDPAIKVDSTALYNELEKIISSL